MKGRFIVFEGGEATGKSTQARLLAHQLGAVLTREPGGTELGLRLRELVLAPGSARVSSRAEALLLVADRAQHVEEVVLPALREGRHVVCDRFSGSTLAYQGYGRGLAVADLAMMSSWASGGLEPDLVLLLEVDGGVAAARRVGDSPDRMEAEDEPFHTRVRDGYRALAAADPGRWRMVPGEGPVDEVAARVRQVVRDTGWTDA